MCLTSDTDSKNIFIISTNLMMCRSLTPMALQYCKDRLSELINSSSSPSLPQNPNLSPGSVFNSTYKPYIQQLDMHCTMHITYSCYFILISIIHYSIVLCDVMPLSNLEQINKLQIRRVTCWTCCSEVSFSFAASLSFSML